MIFHFLDHGIVGWAVYQAGAARGARRVSWLAVSAVAFCRTASYHHRRNQ